MTKSKSSTKPANDSEDVISVYELAICARAKWQAHSLSNVGSNGSNRLLSRRQLLACGTETDAYSGNIAKQRHAKHLTDMLVTEGHFVCSACANSDGRRAFASNTGNTNSSMESILKCAICDTHGFLIPGRNATKDSSARESHSKTTLVEFAMSLALPDQSTESTQLYTRSGNNEGDGQMIMKMPARSGIYAQIVRYHAAGIGLDTISRNPLITDEAERCGRHKSILAALQDQFLSPSGALTRNLLPHVSGLEGIITIRTDAGRAPIYSPLDSDYVDQLQQMCFHNYHYFVFQSAAEFSQHMHRLTHFSKPFPIAAWSTK